MRRRTQGSKVWTVHFNDPSSQNQEGFCEGNVHKYVCERAERNVQRYAARGGEGWKGARGGGGCW